MMKQQPQVKRKNKAKPTPKESSPTSQIQQPVSHNKKKKSAGGNAKKKEILPQAIGGIQRITQRATYKKREFPKTHFSTKITLQEICPICNKEIGKDHTAIQFGTKQEPAHFNCVLKWLEDQHQLNENQQIAYIGSGKFAIITSRSANKQQKLEIIKHLDFNEDLSAIQPQWKRQLAITPELMVSLEQRTESQDQE